MREILEMVVAEGSGKNGGVAGFRIGGKTATSQTLPRGSGRYIASFIGFAPADDPQVIALAIVRGFTMADRWRRRWFVSFLKIFFRI